MSGITVHGPYKHRSRWRLLVKEGGRTITSQSYRTRAEAEEAKHGYLEHAHVEKLWAEVARLEEELAHARAQAEAATQKPVTIGDLMHRYLMYLRDVKQRAGSTVSTTRNKLRAILSSAEDVPARALTAQRAGALYRDRTGESAAATHHGDLRRVRAMWRWAIGQRLVGRDVWKDIELIGTPSEGKDQMHPVAAEILFAHALEQAVSAPPKDRRRRNNPQGAAAVLILLIFGMRSGEIVSLSPEHLDRGLMFVKKGKTRKSRRWMRVPADIWRALEPHVSEARAQGRDRIFPFERDWIRQQVHRLCGECGLPDVSAHALRGTHATLATEAGATAEMVAKQLGHSSTAVTRRHYIDPAAAIQAAAERVYGELSGGSSPRGDHDHERNHDRLQSGSGVGNFFGGKRFPHKNEPPGGRSREAQTPIISLD